MAASVVTTLPMVVLFLLGQRFFVDGIATTGRGSS
jgi:multiple sugar transport system permease protein